MEDNTTLISALLETSYIYKNGKFCSKDKPKTEIDRQTLWLEILGIISSKDSKLFVPRSDFDIIVEEYIKSKNKVTLYSNTDVEESIISQGNYVKLSLFGIEQVPNDAEKKYFKDIRMALDSNEIMTFFLLHNNQYWYLGTSRELDIKKTFEAAKLFNRYHIRWERSLIEYGNGIKNSYNAGGSDLLDYAKTEIPTALLTEFESFIITKKQKLADEEKIVATSVQWGQKSSNPTFFDYIEKVIMRYPTMAIEQMDKFPDVYANIDGSGMSIFDITPYQKDESVTLNKAWMEMKSKYTEDEWSVLCAWIFGVLDSKNRGRQALFIIDYEGFSGKGKLIDVIVELLSKKIVSALTNKSMGDKFGFSKIWDKRLITIGDNKNNFVAKTEWFHNILGGDYIDVEYKNQGSFSAKMNAKLLVCSNNPIEIDPNLLHERTRTIILKPVMPKGLRDSMSAKDEFGNLIFDDQGNVKLLGDNDYVTRLLEGVNEFLITCYQFYKKLCPTRSEIIVPNSVMNNVYDIVPTQTLDLNYYMNQFLIITKDDNDFVSNDDFYKAYQTMCKLQENSSIRNDKNMFSNINQFLIKTPGIINGKVYTDSTKTKRCQGYKGIQLVKNIGTIVVDEPVQTLTKKKLNISNTTGIE